MPHSSHWCTLWPLVALLTRPVLVYLIESPSGGVEERCISLSREEPWSWGLPGGNGPVPEATGSSVDSGGCSETLLAERGERGGGAMVGESLSALRIVEGPWPGEAASGCMLGSASAIYVSEADRWEIQPSRSPPRALTNRVTEKASESGRRAVAHQSLVGRPRICRGCAPAQR